MRLICPNCDAEYEVPDGMVPAAGRHVQCTSCHTRWFARGTAEAAPSEDQIVTRLETRRRRAGRGPVAGRAPAPAGAGRRGRRSCRCGRPQPAGRPPAVPRPGEISADRAGAPRRAAARPRPAAPRRRARRRRRRRRGRFGLGLAVALLFFLLALGAYDLRREIAAERARRRPGAGRPMPRPSTTCATRLEQRLATLRARIGTR